MKYLRFLSLLLICALLLCACGEQPAETTVPTTAEPTTEPTTEPATVPTTEPPMDAQTLLALLRQTDAETEHTGLKGTTACSMTINLSTLGMTMDMSMEQETSGLFDPAAEREYMEITSTVTSYGQTAVTTSQRFTFPENGEKVSYTHELEANIWSREIEEEDGPDMLECVLEDTLVLEEQTQQWGDWEVYVLRMDLSDEYTQDMTDAFMEGMNEGMNAAGSTGRDDRKDVTLACHAVMYVEKETGLLRGYTVDVEGLDLLMEEYFAEIFSSQTGTGIPMTVEVEMETMRYEATELTYDPVELPEMDPKGIVAANQESFEPAQEDGTYIIQESGEAVQIKLLSGWNVDSAEYNSLTLNRGDDNHYCYYTMYSDGYTLEENVQYWVDYYYQNYQVSMESGTGEPVNGYETMWYRGGGLYSWCMQIPVGDCYLFIEATSYINTDTYSYLEHFAANCTEYDLTAAETP